MSVGFGATTETQMQVCKNTIKQLRRKLPLDSIVSEGKRKHRITPVKGNYDKSKMFDADTGIEKVEVGLKKHIYCNGLWYIQVYKQGPFSTYDIGISIPYMDGTFDSSYSPITIKEEIVRQFGADFYEDWRIFVNSKINDLKELVEYVRNDIDSIYSSVWCCRKSKNLLKRLGFPVIGDWTFLTPSRYQ